MKPTHYSKNYKLQLFVMWLSAIFGVGTAVIGLYGIHIRILRLFFVVEFFALWMIIESVGYILYFTREYKFDEIGITICYAKKWTRFHPWKDVTDVSVCRIFDKAKQPTYFDVIWVSFGQPTTMPPKGNGVVAAAGFHNMFSVLTVEFSRVRLQEIQEFYKDEIIDYRPTGLYVPPPREEYR